MFDPQSRGIYPLVMSPKAEKVASEALQLTREERAFLAEKLLESLDHEEPLEIDPEWRAEVLRRCREIDEGKVELVPGDEVLREAGDEVG
jgi:putative addiction module component (TIGR02574 family)